MDPYLTVLSGGDPDKGTSEHRHRDEGLLRPHTRWWRDGGSFNRSAIRNGPRRH